jgi:hypothetical protein
VPTGVWMRAALRGMSSSLVARRRPPALALPRTGRVHPIPTICA